VRRAAAGANGTVKGGLNRRQAGCLLVGAMTRLSARSEVRTPSLYLPFLLRSSFWMNLHHVLAELVQADGELADWRRPQGWSGTEAQAWQSAQALYAEAFAKADVVFDNRFQALRRSLLGLTETQPLPPLEPELVPFGEALQEAAEPYRHHLWPQHATLNERWIQQARPLLDRHGEAVRKRLEAVLQPALPRYILVDVVAHAANFAGAYTHPRPDHTVMPSTRHSYQGFASLEMLFHEACHTGMDDRLIQDINALLAPRGLQDRRGLWHATQFYTVGHVTQGVLAEAGVDYEPYGLREKVLARAWPFSIAPLETHWRPYLEGRRPQAEALAALVASCYPA